MQLVVQQLFKSLLYWYSNANLGYFLYILDKKNAFYPKENCTFYEKIFIGMVKSQNTSQYSININTGKHLIYYSNFLNCMNHFTASLTTI